MTLYFKGTFQDHQCLEGFKIICQVDNKKTTVLELTPVIFQV